MTRCLLVFPPQWSPFSPHLAPVVISSAIKKAGHKCDIRDLNIEFYNDILKKEFLKDKIVKILNDFLLLKRELKDKIIPDQKAEDYSTDFGIKAKKMLRINELTEKTEQTKQIIEYIDGAVSILKDKENFYDIKLLVNSLAIINKALEIVTLQEFPQELSLYNFKNHLVQFNYENILKYCSKNNMFYTYYDSKIDEIIKNKYQLICISISSSTQLLSALTFARMIKTKSKKTKICIGGNYISRVTDALKNNKDFFNKFADFVIYEEGERAITELLETFIYKRKLDDVSSLIYLDKNEEIKFNSKKVPTKLNELAIPQPQGFPLKKYFLPEIIMPIQASRGCYWKKCTFCDHDWGQTFNIKDIDILINEIKTLKDKYSINNFEFTDDCISASFLEQFSKKLISENLNINWYCDLRLEKAFTYEILELANKAGLKMVLWGYEAGSKRIMELINKGIDIDERLEILKNADKAGIWNFAYVFTGFPSETYDEAMETIDIVCNNSDIFHSYGRSIFTMGKHSAINLHPENFDIVKLDDIEDFSSDALFERKSGMTKEELEKVNNLFVEKALKKYDNPAWMFLNYREVLFLYIKKFGKEQVLNMKYKI